MRLLFALLFLCPISAIAQQTSAEQQIKHLNIELFTPKPPQANFVRVVQTGNLVFIAGHGPSKADGSTTIGKVGIDLNTEEAYVAARQACIALLSSLKAEIGSLDKVKRIVKVTGWVNCPADFKDQPKVMNGCSDLLVEIFGDAGKHARAALGTNALPGNMAVEIEMIIELY